LPRRLGARYGFISPADGIDLVSDRIGRGLRQSLALSKNSQVLP
jgi:hypothetical protein